MQWTLDAEEALAKVPFFVRKRVRARVEEEARRAGRNRVTLAEVKVTQKRFLAGMASEVKGYQLDTCFGPSGCPNRIGVDSGLVDKIEACLKDADLLAFLQDSVQGELKFHHEFRVTLADCPNACSQPQIKDIGLLAACRPRVTDAVCTGCENCVHACRDEAVRLDAVVSCPTLDMERCVACGQCITACSTGTLAEGEMGYRVQLGGKLGRHPRLARELPGIYSPEAVLEIVQACLDLHKAHSRNGQRFGELLTETRFEGLARTFASRRIAATA